MIQLVALAQVLCAILILLMRNNLNLPTIGGPHSQIKHCEYYVYHGELKTDIFNTPTSVHHNNYSA